MKILNGSDGDAVLIEGLGVYQDGDAFAFSIFQPYHLFAGLAVEDGGHQGAHGLAQVGAFFVDVVEAAFEAVLTLHFFCGVAADAFGAFAPVENAALCVYTVHAIGHFVDDLFQKLQFCDIHRSASIHH